MCRDPVYFTSHDYTSNDADISRDHFEKSSLVYVPDDRCWKAPSSCLWASPVEITGKSLLSKLYGPGQKIKSLKAFFVDCLRVPDVSLRILVEELKSVAKTINGRELSSKDTGALQRVKILIKALNSMPLGQPEAVSMGEKLRCESIFPVTKKQVSNEGLNKSMILASTADYFSIKDRQNYWESFKGQVWMLDFTLEEVSELGPFLRWLKVEERYLSRSVSETSSFGGVDEMSSVDLTRDLQKRAKALLRYVREQIENIAC